MSDKGQIRRTILRALPATAVVAFMAMALIAIVSAVRSRDFEARTLGAYSELAAWSFAYRGYAAHRDAPDSVRVDALAQVYDAPIAFLPQSMTHVSYNADLASVIVRDSTGHVIYQSERQYPSDYAATVDFGPRGNGLATLSLSPRAIEGLLRGGVPGRNAQMQIVIALLALSLAIAIIVTMRRAQHLARIRADFAASITHELRTPLTHILLSAETLELGRARTDDERRRFASAITQETRRLVQLIDNVLHFSRAERRMLHVQPESLRLDTLARDAVALETSFSPDAASRLRLGSADTIYAFADAQAMAIVLHNAIDNALRHARGPIDVSVRADGRQAHVLIDDSGPGIPARDRRHVLRPFVRLACAHEQHPSGSGIGLAVIAESVRAMSGTLSLEDAPTGGLRVRISLPLTMSIASTA